MSSLNATAILRCSATLWSLHNIAKASSSSTSCRLVTPLWWTSCIRAAKTNANWAMLSCYNPKVFFLRRLFVLRSFPGFCWQSLQRELAEEDILKLPRLLVEGRREMTCCWFGLLLLAQSLLILLFSFFCFMFEAWDVTGTLEAFLTSQFSKDLSDDSLILSLRNKCFKINQKECFVYVQETIERGGAELMGNFGGASMWRH